MDNLTKEQRHKNMQHIRSKDTSIECLLRKELWHRGIRFRKNYKNLPGKPDIVITKYRIAIFCDSEFFHGQNWENLREKLNKSSNSPYWINKISRNIERDREVEAQLKGMGWTVLRFWGKDIKKDVTSCVRAVEEMIFDKKIEKIGEDFI